MRRCSPLGRLRRYLPRASVQLILPSAVAGVLPLGGERLSTGRLTMRTAQWIVASFWVLSWFFLYREIYVWHHVTPSFHLNPPPRLPGLPPPHPGMFVLSVLVASPTAPLILLVLVIVDLLWRRRAKPSFHG
jgi:hypothetical protein